MVLRDDEKNIVRHIHTDGTTDAYRYDRYGNLIRHLRADAGEIYFQYDSEHRITGILDPDGGRWKRDCNDPTSRGPKDATEMAQELSGQINQNSVAFSTPTTQGHIDLHGASHFDKTSGTDIPTPHVQIRVVNVGPDGQVTTSKKTEVTEPATKQDVRVARELARRKGLRK